MQYKSRINPELKHIAVKVPYNKVIIMCANVFQVISLYIIKIPEKVNRRKFAIAGYRGLKCKVDVFEPSNGKEKLPALLYVHGGACIAAMICNQYEAKGLKKPCLQMLIYPLTDIGMQTESMKKYKDTPLWNAKNNGKMWQYYCGYLYRNCGI